MKKTRLLLIPVFMITGFSQPAPYLDPDLPVEQRAKDLVSRMTLPYEDYSMKGRTCRYMQEEPLYPFGFGLTYTSFAHSGLQLSKNPVRKGESVEVSAVVKNNGKMAAEEVVQCYVTDVEASIATPAHQLRGFKRIRLGPGESQTVAFTISAEAMEPLNNDGQRVLESGDFRVTIAGAVPIKRSQDLGATVPVSAVFTVN